MVKYVAYYPAIRPFTTGLAIAFMVVQLTLVFITETFEEDTTGAAAIGSGYTYSGHPVGAAAAIACLKETQRLNVKDNAAARGHELMRGLEELKNKHAVVGDVRGGEGLMNALELVADPVTKKPLSKILG